METLKTGVEIPGAPQKEEILQDPAALKEDEVFVDSSTSSCEENNSISENKSARASDELGTRSALVGDYDIHRSPSTRALMMQSLEANYLLENDIRRRKRKDSYSAQQASLATSVLSETTEMFMEGVDDIFDDNFWKCFQSKKPRAWNWNLYLLPFWLVGIITRYCVLFPIRLFFFVLGWVLFGFGMLLVQVCLPRGSKRRTKLEHRLISFQCGVFAFTWGAVVRFHGSPPAHGQRVFVANHTSMIDVIILQQMRCFSLVGQKHKGVVRFLQETVLSCLQCVWFDRGEMKDRQVVAQKLKQHAQDTDRNPLLVFPEGTCVNNEYAIQFKKGPFELGVPICPVAIKYNKIFVDPFWNSKKQSFQMHLFELMTSWCLICDVWYLEPQVRRSGESAVDFAARCKAKICHKAGLKNVDLDGYMKYWKPSSRFVQGRQERFAETLREIFRKEENDSETEVFHIGRPQSPLRHRRNID